ncbi:hypothetical protein [Paenibacillus tianjinensis]|uniref:Uncharacterized protein n=1 Tax=Paenibacillus tianjinensis TaxID=2810347 RepID=A0ABX7L9D0_9BACL|nr:hypothetical protein [Paenibacillus tianjinensis]QSF42647.1 hypothetical protein JRJ22_15120 [Paenibacillus tianjinensis]
MNDQEIEREIESARSEDGTYPVEWVVKMNNAGVWFSFMADGVRWKREPFI